MNNKTLLIYIILVYFSSSFINDTLLAFFISLYILSVIALTLKSKHLSRSKSKLTNLFFSYIILSIISTLWSPEPFNGLFFSILNLCLFINIINVLKKKDAHEVSYHILFLIAIIETVVMFYIQNSSDDFNIIESFHGGGSLQSALCLLMYNRLKKTKTNRIIFYLSLILVIISTSYKIYLGLLVVFVLRLRNYKKIIGIISVLILTYVNYEKLIQLDYGKIEHLGGRLYPWLIMITKSQNKPILGHSFANGDEIYLYEGFTIMNAHNVFIGSLVYFGVIGLALMTLVFYQFYKQSKSTPGYLPLYYVILISCLFNIGIAGKISSTLISIFIIMSLLENKAKTL